MERNEYVAAVDLGTTKVIIAVGRRADKNKVEIVALKEIASAGVIKGDLRNIEQASRALKDVKSRIESEMGITIHDVVVGISGQHIKCTPATGYVFVQNSDREVSEVCEADVKRLKDDMRNTAIPLGQTIITVLPQAYTLDEETDIIEPVGMEGRRLEAKFNLIVGEDASIERIRRCFSRVGLSVSGIVLQPLASAEAVLSEDEKELGVAVVDIGGGTTDLCIYYDKVIRHIAVIPIGGNIINKDIKAYGILERHVEKLKVSFGEAIADRAPGEKYINIPSVSGQAPKEIAIKSLAGIIEARMMDIIDCVMLEIEKCGCKGKLGAGLVLTGGGATLKNLDVLFKHQLGMEVRVASPMMHLVAESLELVANPKYATVAGLIVDGVRSGRYSLVDNVYVAAPVGGGVVGAASAMVGGAASSMSSSSVVGNSASFAAVEVDVLGGDSFRGGRDQGGRGAQDYVGGDQDVVGAHGYQDDGVDQVGGVAQGELVYQDDQYEEEYYDEEPTVVEKPRRQRVGLVDRAKRLFGNMFEEVDDEDNY